MAGKICLGVARCGCFAPRDGRVGLLLGAGKALARRVEKLISFTELPTSLQTYGVTSDAINGLAAEASKEWTAQFNPRMVKHNDFVTLYNRAL